MKQHLRRATLGALFLVFAVPGVASAAFSPVVASVGTVTAGCQPKGGNVLPVAGAGTLVGAQSYRVTAVVGGTEQAPCTELQTNVGPAASGALVQWNVTPGATAYRVYRGAQRLVQLPNTPLICPSAGTDPGPRCRYVDGGAAPTSDTPPALPATQTQAGSSPDVNIAQTFDYAGDPTLASDDPAPNGTDANSASLRTNIIKFPTGLLANPTAASAKCTLTQLIGDPAVQGTADANEDKCPRASQVGTVLARIQTPPVVPQNPPTPTVGDIYLGENLGAETARLYVVLRPACSSGSFVAPDSATCNTAGVPDGFEVEKSFLSAIATVDNDGAISNATTSVATGVDEPLAPKSNVRSTASGADAGDVPIQVRSITQYLWGFADQGTADTADDKAFTALPTSCAAKSMGAVASSYLDPVEVAATAATLQATNCEGVPFNPNLAMVVNASGQSGQNGHPEFIATVSQAVGEAATQSAVVTLPEGLGANFVAVGNACTQAQAATTAGCPASATVGTAKATTPALPGELSGPIVLRESATAGSLPELEVRLRGAASVTLTGAISFDSTNTRLVNTFNPIPEVPLSTFELKIAGGASGLLQNTRDIGCEGLGQADGVFNGYNGKSKTLKTGVTVNGATCEYVIPPGEKQRPGLSAKVRPKRDTQKPYRFRTTGRLRRPSGVSAADGCSGRVRITVTRGKKRVGRKSTPVKANCTFSRTVKFKSTKKFGKRKARRRGTLKFAIRYGGNDVFTAVTVRRTAKYTK